MESSPSLSFDEMAAIIDDPVDNDFEPIPIDLSQLQQQQQQPAIDFVPSPPLPGQQILVEYPDGLHFLAGCGSFDVLHNKKFRDFVHNYFVDRLHHDATFRQAVGKHTAVTGEIDKVLQQARRRYGTVRIWYKQNRQDSVKKATWHLLTYKDITANEQEIRSRLGEVLRNILTVARAEYMAGGVAVPGSSKALRHVVGGVGNNNANNNNNNMPSEVSSSLLSSTQAIKSRKKNKRAHENDDKDVEALADEETMIQQTKDEIWAKVKQDINELKAIDDLTVFKEQVEYGIIMSRLGNLTTARIKAGKKWTEWTQGWAQRLYPKEEQPEGTFDAQEHLEANRLDADRKVCVEYLKRLHRDFSHMGSVQVAKLFPRRHLFNILSCTLEMDRSKARFFNLFPPKGCRGMHWFAEKHLDLNSPRWYRQTWAEYVQDYEGEATISRRIMWLFDEEAFGLQDEKKYKSLWELLEPQKANWVDVEGNQVD